MARRCAATPITVILHSAELRYAFTTQGVLQVDFARALVAFREQRETHSRD
jgi:hypothetical protein